MTDAYSTGSRWQDTVAVAIPSLPYPLRKDREQRPVYPAGLQHLADAAQWPLCMPLEPSPRDGLAFVVDGYLDGARRVR